jgi:organic radical activating enzyme
MDEDVKLRFDTVEYHNKTSAPWVSSELFVTGCHKRCPECFNKSLQSLSAGRRETVNSVKISILTVYLRKYYPNE